MIPSSSEEILFFGRNIALRSLLHQTRSRRPHFLKSYQETCKASSALHAGALPGIIRQRAQLETVAIGIITMPAAHSRSSRCGATHRSAVY